MPDPAAARWVSGAHQWARISLAPLVIGPSLLLVYAWVEVLNNPGLSLADGFLIGREPWTSIGIVVSLSGGVAGLLSGSVAIAIEGGWWRRSLLVPAFAAAALWWLTALGLLPYPRFDGPDPLAFASIQPWTASLLVLMPAALLAVLALTPRMTSAPRTRLRPVSAPARRPPSSIAAEEDDPDELIS